MSNASVQVTKPPVTLQDRFEFGFFTVDHLCDLANRSRTAFYADVKAGLVKIDKVGRSSRVYGPNAKAYIRQLTEAR